MSKFLRTAGEIIAVAVAVAAAIPSGGTSLLAGALAVSAGTASAIAAGVSVSITALEALTAKKPTQVGNPMAWKSEPNAGIPHIAGRMYFAGQITYRETYQKNNEAETIQTVYSTGPIKGYESLYVDGVATSVDGITANIVDRGHMYVSTQLGAQPEPKQLGDLGPPNFTAASKMSGLAASSITFTYDTSGGHTLTTEPQTGYVILGTPVYDPRQDSTYPGGNGTQRSNDETTWSFTGYDNPGLKALSYLIGYRQNGSVVIGVGLPISAIRVDQLVEMANVCDANGWKMGGVIMSTDERWTMYGQILQAGGAVPTRSGTRTGCIVNTPKVSLATFERDDIIGDWSIQGSTSRRARINAIVPSYMAEQSVVGETSDANGNTVLQTTVTWGMAAAGVITVPDYATFDGGQRQKAVSYPFVTGHTTTTDDLAPNQVAQLARYDIENSREFGPIAMTMKPRWMGYQAGDVITGGVSTTEMGLVGQDIMLLQRSFSPTNMTVSMTARSETKAKHAFALGQTTTPPPTPSLSGPPLIPTPGPDEWAITATQVGEGGSIYPGLVISGASTSKSIDAIIFEYRFYTGTQAAGDDWVAAGSEQPSTTSKPILILHDGASCQAAVSYRKGVGTGTRLILGPETIGTTTIDFANIDGTTKTALLNEVSDAGTAAAAASAQLAVISSDGYLSRGEKPAVIQDYNAIVAEAPLLNQQAGALGFNGGTGSDPNGSAGDEAIYHYNVAYGALQTYLASLSPAWNDTTQDTAIVAATFRGKFDDYYFAKITLTTAIDAAASKVATWDGVYGTGKDSLIAEAATAASNAASALTQLGVIAADGYLSRGEKPQVIQDFTAIAAEKPQLDAQAATLGVSAATYDTAFTALQTYLGGLSPAWNDTTQDTAIVAATFRGKFTDYYYARTLLVNAMAQAAAQAVPTVNRVYFSQFEKGTIGWALRSNPSSLAITGPAVATGGTTNTPYVQASAAATAAGQSFSLGTQAGYEFTVTPGERIQVQAGLQASGPSGTTGSLVLWYLDSTGKAFSPATIWSGGIIPAFTLEYQPVSVPPNASKAYLELYVTAGAAGQILAGITQPMASSVPISQAGALSFVAGPNAVPGADITSQNVAADTAAVNGVSSATTQANITAAGNLANTANSTAAIGAQLASDVADNNKFSSTEKKRWVEKINSLQGTVANEIAQGNALGLQTQTAALQAAYSALYNYLSATVSGIATSNTPPPNYTDTAHTSAINSNTFKNYVYVFDSANAALATAAQQYAATSSAAASAANLFLDPTFSRLTDTTAWAQFNPGYVVQADPGGQRVRFPSGMTVESDLIIPKYLLGFSDRVDLEFEYFIESSVTSNSYLGIAVRGYDATGTSLWGNLFSVSASSATKGGWTKATGSIVVNAQGNYASTAFGDAYLLCGPVSGGNIYIRNPRAYVIKASQQLLSTTGRGTTALLNSTSIVAGIKVVNNTGFVLSSTPNGTSNVTVNVGAFTYTTDSGMTLSYPAGSFPGLAFNTTYYVWRVDPNLNGGTSYGISTSLNDASKPGQLYVGYIITPTTAGTGGGGGGGGSQGCVTADMWVATDQGDVLASDIKPGDKVLCLTEDLAGTEYAEVTSNEPATNWCIEITSASGVTLDLAVNTPMTPRSGAGGAIMAANVWAQDVAIVVDGVLSWEPCTIKALPDMPTVAQIDLGGRIFAAGKEKGRYLFSHNGVSKP